jgi:hypothetical protein
MSKQRGKDRMRGIYRDWMVSMLKRMVNRPETISYTNALLWGVAWLIISTIGGWRLLLAPTSVVSYDVVGYMPLIRHLLLTFTEILTVYLRYPKSIARFFSIQGRDR